MPRELLPRAFAPLEARSKLLLLCLTPAPPGLYILSSGRYDPRPSLHERFWPQRQPVETGRNFQLTEEDLLRAARAVLPVANSFISTSQVIFSGNPSMTLKVSPVLLFGAKYMVTLWRLLATGFFSSFTLPKMYICYSTQIRRTVENVDRTLEAWKSCPHKKLIASTEVTMFWNLFSIKTHFLAENRGWLFELQIGAGYLSSITGSKTMLRE